jgi:hypothetical protein
MKLITSLTITIALAAPLLAQTPTPNSSGAEAQAKQELIEAARVYREGKFAEAQAHSEKALLLDPQNKTAPSFVARTIHAQYKPGDTTPENLAKAREAISAYRSYKTNILLELAKLAEMLGEVQQKRELHRQYEEALRVTTMFSKRSKSKP